VVCRVAALARSNESYCLEAATADGASGNDARNDHSTDPDQAIVLTGARSVVTASLGVRSNAGSCRTVAC
jgi:hypothetical protein